MSRIPFKFTRRENHESKLPRSIVAAWRVARSQSWALALAALLYVAAVAQGQAGSGALATVTYLGSSTTNSVAPQTILAATVLNSNSNSAPAPTGTVTFLNGTTVVGAGPLDSSGVATVVLNLPAGSYTVTAYYSGDLQHSTSTSPAVTVNVSGTGFNLNVNPATVTVATQRSTTVTVTLASVDGFADNIGLGCASLPPGVTCSFSNISADLVANENPAPTVRLTIDADNPLVSDSSTTNSQHSNRNTELAGLFLPVSVFFGLIYWRFRKRQATVITPALPC